MSKTLPKMAPLRDLPRKRVKKFKEALSTEERMLIGLGCMETHLDMLRQTEVRILTSLGRMETFLTRQEQEDLAIVKGMRQVADGIDEALKQMVAANRQHIFHAVDDSLDKVYKVHTRAVTSAIDAAVKEAARGVERCGIDRQTRIEQHIYHVKLAVQDLAKVLAMPIKEEESHEQTTAPAQP